MIGNGDTSRVELKKMTHDNKDDDEIGDKQGESKKVNVCPMDVKKYREGRKEKYIRRRKSGR